jgi:hypothetical protein
MRFNAGTPKQRKFFGAVLGRYKLIHHTYNVTEEAGDCKRLYLSKITTVYNVKVFYLK